MSDSFGNYRPGENLQAWNKTMPQTIHTGPRISGNGSPEGVVAGPVGLQYEDLQTSPHDLYMKLRGTAETGWSLIGLSAVSGTTGSVGGYPVLYGTTAERDATIPTSAFAVWFLTDSDPAYQVSIWANSVWN